MRPFFLRGFESHRYFNAGRNPSAYNSKIKRANVRPQNFFEIRFVQDARFTENIHLDARGTCGNHILANLHHGRGGDEKRRKESPEGDGGGNTDDLAQWRKNRPQQNTEDNRDAHDKWAGMEALMKQGGHGCHRLTCLEAYTRRAMGSSLFVPHHAPRNQREEPARG